LVNLEEKNVSGQTETNKILVPVIYNNRNAEYINLSVIDILKWLSNQKCLPIPCQPRKKKPILDVCKHKILDNGFEYGLFETTYHDASPDRVEWIKNYWKRWDNIINEDETLIEEISPTKLSMALNTGNGWNNNQFLSVIDIDNVDYIEDFNIDLFKDCPRVYGKTGVKILFFSKGDIQQGIILKEDGKEHIIDLYFSSPRLVFIYGEHPSSTEDIPVYYRIDELKPIPILSRLEVLIFISRLCQKRFLKLKLENKKDIIRQPQKVNEYGKAKPSLSNMSNLRLSDVISFSSNLIVHPVHGATHGGNVSLNVNDDTWYCHRCHSGGGVIELIAVIEGIIDCDEAQPNLFNFKTERNVDKWLELKLILEQKYNVDVFKYDVGVRKWYNDKKVSTIQKTLLKSPPKRWKI
jgi:hypothetical protein